MCIFTSFLKFFYSIYPTFVNVRIFLCLLDLLSIRRHRAAEASDSVIAFVVQLAMLYSERIEESPDLFVRPLDDWRDKQRLVSPYAADDMFICSIGDVYFVYPTLSRSATFL